MATAGFLHTSPVHVATFVELLAELAPGKRVVSVVDESLLADARVHGPQAVANRVVEVLTHLVHEGADVVCCTCSTIGTVAEQASVGVPVFRVDRPMTTRAVRTGTRVGVLAALASTVGPTRAVLLEEAHAAGVTIDLRVVVVAGAWDCFEAGDHAGYLSLITDAARTLAPKVDVLVLAQASMADAEPLLTDLPVPVLSSPRPAAEYLAEHL